MRLYNKILYVIGIVVSAVFSVTAAVHIILEGYFIRTSYKETRQALEDVRKRRKLTAAKDTADMAALLGIKLK